VLPEHALLGDTITADRNTVKPVLSDQSLEPAPERKRRTPWRASVKAHWDISAAIGFFRVEVLTCMGIIRYQVLSVTHLKTREVQITGIAAQPCKQWKRNGGKKVHANYPAGVGGPLYVKAGAIIT